MARCKQCGEELIRLEDGRYKCEGCGLVYTVRKVVPQNTDSPSPQTAVPAATQQTVAQSYRPTKKDDVMQSPNSAPSGVATQSYGGSGNRETFHYPQSPQHGTPPAAPAYNLGQGSEGNGSAHSDSGQDMPVPPSKIKWIVGFVLSLVYVIGNIAQLILSRYLTSLKEDGDVLLRFINTYGENAEQVMNDLVFVNGNVLPLLVNAFLVFGLILLILCAANSKYKLALGILTIHPFSKFVFAASGMSAFLEMIGGGIGEEPALYKMLFFFENLDLATPLFAVAAAALIVAGLQEVRSKSCNNMIQKEKIRSCSAFARGAVAVLIIFAAVSIVKMILVSYLPIALGKIDLSITSFESSELYEAALEDARESAELPSKIMGYVEVGLYYLGILWIAVMIRPRNLTNHLA